jgi:hypothetical protein
MRESHPPHIIADTEHTSIGIVQLAWPEDYQ